MQKELQIIRSNYSDDFGKIEFPMILTSQEIDDVKYRSAKEAIDNANFRRKLNDIDKISCLNISSSSGVDQVLEILNVDVEAAIDYANRMKHGEIQEDIWRSQVKEHEIIKKKQVEAYWTAERMYRFMKYTAGLMGKELVFDEDNGHAIEALCYFVSEDRRFETKLGYSFEKGIILMGGYGTGKSYLPTLLKDNERCPIKMYSMIKIEHHIRETGSFNINLSKNHFIYLDDVGTEADIQKHFGNQINWFQEWIELIYADGLHFNRLILSTNLNSEGIEQRYTGRVRSRLSERMNVIPLLGKDRRSSCCPT